MQRPAKVGNDSKFLIREGFQGERNCWGGSLKVSLDFRSTSRKGRNFMRGTLCDKNRSFLWSFTGGTCPLGKSLRALVEDRWWGSGVRENQTCDGGGGHTKNDGFFIKGGDTGIALSGTKVRKRIKLPNGWGGKGHRSEVVNPT